MVVCEEGTRAEPAASVIIPAHDEATLIDRCLATLRHGAEPGELDIVVVCNGCTDDTAARAARHPGVRVVTIAQAAKSAALDAGDAAAHAFPRVYLDADVLLDVAALRALVRAFAGGQVDAAAPRPRFDSRGRPWAVRRYFAVAQRLPAFGHGFLGLGVYALSARGRAAFGAWPADLPDDGFVQCLFPPQRRTTVPCDFGVEVPWTLAAHLRRMVRMQRLNRRLQRATDVHGGTLRSTAMFLLRELRSPAAWPGVAVFAIVGAASRIMAAWTTWRRQPLAWGRDHSIRGLPNHGHCRVPRRRSP